MNYNRNDILEIAQEFIDICNKNDVWFSADAYTILGSKRHGGFVPWKEKIQVMMTPESYRKLQRLFPKKIVDSSVVDGYDTLRAAWIRDIEKWKEEQPFIEIRVVVPTTIKAIKKFKSPLKNTLSSISGRKDNLKHAIDDLFVEKNEGFYLITRRNSDIMRNWIPNLTFKTETLNFNGIEFPVIKEWESVMKSWFGENYLDVPEFPSRYYSYPGPNIKIKEENF